MSRSSSGRAELGQNFLTDRATIAATVALVARTDGPIVEIGPGDGALTRPLQRLHRPITAVEIDPRRVRRLRNRLDPARTTVVHADFLRFPLPRTPYAIVGNVPFHLSTAVLRRVLAAEHWTAAVLLTQWEVARRRAGIGGATLMTAQWWPWFEFTVDRRVPAAAFVPRPGVDAGLLLIHRRARPLLPRAVISEYRTFVHAVFTGRGHGLHRILPRLVPRADTGAVRRWLSAQRFPGPALPRDLSAEQWAELFGHVIRTAPTARDRPSGSGSQTS